MPNKVTPEGYLNYAVHEREAADSEGDLTSRLEHLELAERYETLAEIERLRSRMRRVTKMRRTGIDFL